MMTMRMQFGASGYLDDTFDPKKLARCVKRVAGNMKKLKKTLRFDAIAFRGISGAALAFPVSALTGIPLIYIRKEKNSHGDKIEGVSKSVRTYVILDDFVSLGGTVRSIIKMIESRAANSGQLAPACKGVCLYSKFASGEAVRITRNRSIRIHMV